MTDSTYTEQAMQAFATIHSGLTRRVLGLLAVSGQMRTSTELQSRLDTTQSETIRALTWLEEWGLVTHVAIEEDDVTTLRYALTNAGALVYRFLPTLDR